jgi:hypothetical protein
MRSLVPPALPLALQEQPTVKSGTMAAPGPVIMRGPGPAGGGFCGLGCGELWGLARKPGGALEGDVGWAKGKSGLGSAPGEALGEPAVLLPEARPLLLRLPKFGTPLPPLSPPSLHGDWLSPPPSEEPALAELDPPP